MDKDFYFRYMRSFLGDDGGRRFTETNLEMGLRAALQYLDSAAPARIEKRAVVKRVYNRAVLISLFIGTTGRIIEVWDQNKRLIPFVEADRSPNGIELIIEEYYSIKAGDLLTVKITCPHMIDGLNGDFTTVPDDLNLALSQGAAGHALEVRARSVTEVFGKRPEDTEKLLAQAAALKQAFKEFVAGIPKFENPLPAGNGFPI